MVFPTSNLPTASQPWGREMQKQLVNAQTTIAANDINNSARDVQLQANFNRVNAAALAATAAAADAQEAIDAITGVTTNIYVEGTTNIDGGTIQTGTIDAETINAGTLTGFNIQTAATGQRVIMNGTALSFYNTSNYSGMMYGATASGEVSVTVESGDGSGIMQVFNGGAFIGRSDANYFSLYGTSYIRGNEFRSTASLNTFTQSANFQTTLSVTGRLTADERILNIGGYNAVVANATNMFIASNGAIARTTTTSSREAKQNIRPLSFNADNFISVSPVLFDYKDGIITEGSGDDITGFIAEDFQDAGFAELITPKESETDYIGLRYDKLYMYLHKVVAMQNERIKLLEGK